MIRSLTVTMIIEEPKKIPWPDPTEEMLGSAEFDRVWDCIKQWDIAVPGAYGGYSEATGNHVRAILDALAWSCAMPDSEPSVPMPDSEPARSLP